MCVQMKASEFRQKVVDLARGKDHNTIFEYLRTSGMVMNERGGVLSIEEDCLKKVEFFTSEVQVGDVVWNGMQGLLLVVDKHPAANNDGHHYRALKVTTNTDGDYMILGEQRSIIIDDKESFRLKHTSFDMAVIEKLSYERYVAFRRITEINKELTEMKEVDHGSNT